MFANSSQKYVYVVCCSPISVRAGAAWASGADSARRDRPHARAAGPAAQMARRSERAPEIGRGAPGEFRGRFTPPPHHLRKRRSPIEFAIFLEGQRAIRQFSGGMESRRKKRGPGRKKHEIAISLVFGPSKADIGLGIAIFRISANNYRGCRKSRAVPCPVDPVRGRLKSLVPYMV